MINKIKKKLTEHGFLNIILSLIYLPFYYLLRFLILSFSNCIKVKENQILFYSIPDCSDNAKYYYEFLYDKNTKKNKYIWLVNDIDKYKFNNYKNTKYIKAFTLLFSKPTIKSIYYILSSKEIYYTHVSPFQPIPNKMKQQQLVINLWHGCGYKKSEIVTKSKPLFNYALVPGNAFIKTKCEFWNCNSNQILNIGYPRYDLFYNDNSEVEIFLNKFNVYDKKIIIWMPTFRKTEGTHFAENKIDMKFDLPILNNMEEVESINKICKEKNLFLIVKRHPIQLKYICEENNYSNIAFINNEFLEQNKVELYSLLTYTNGLITDYSSVAIDYLLLNKQIAFTLNDIEQYSNIRGFVFDDPLEYMPGKFVYDFKDFCQYLDDIENNNDEYLEQRKKVISKVHNICDNYCERLYNYVEKIKEGDLYQKK